jgi:SAM-dependent methyltransferase
MIAAVADRVYGVDFDTFPVKYSRGRYGSTTLRFLVGDATELPLKRASADVVVSFEVIEHVVDHKRFLNEASRVLKPDGTLVISTPNRETAELFRQKAGFTWDAHVSEVGMVDFQKELQQYFNSVRIWGMRLRGSRLYGFLRALDPWNFRLRILSRRGIDFARYKVFHVPSQSLSFDDVVISRRQLRQANQFLAVCSGKRV